MYNTQRLITLFQNSSLELHKTLTSTLNSGGAVSYDIYNVLLFIIDKKLLTEIEFLTHLIETNSLTQEAIECFFKHMMFNKETARSFVEWQRKNSPIIT